MMTTADPFVQFASKVGWGVRKPEGKRKLESSQRRGGGVIQIGQENCLDNDGLGDTR